MTNNSLESDKYDPSLPLAFKIARFFELPIDDIFDDEQDAVPSSSTNGRNFNVVERR